MAVKYGRPTKYKTSYCEEVVEHLKNGKSLSSFAATIGTHREVLWKWRAKHEAFNHACLAGLELSQQWWENLSMQIATGHIFHKDHDGKYKKHNPGMVQFLMKQRFEDYRNGPKVSEDSEQKNDTTFALAYDPEKLKDVK